MDGYLPPGRLDWCGVGCLTSDELRRTSRAAAPLKRLDRWVRIAQSLVKPQRGGYRVRLRFEDGVEGGIDAIIRFGVFEIVRFELSVDPLGTIYWPNGAESRPCRAVLSSQELSPRMRDQIGSLSAGRQLSYLSRRVLGINGRQ